MKDKLLGLSVTFSSFSKESKSFPSHPLSILHSLKFMVATLLPIAQRIADRKFPAFSLERLLKTTFGPKPEQRLCVLIDLENPADIKDFAFLKDPSLTIQSHAVNSFLKPLRESVLAKLGMNGGEIFAYKLTGGSNLDLPDEAFTPDGEQVSLSTDVYPDYDIILCISPYAVFAINAIAHLGTSSRTKTTPLLQELIIFLLT
jgi:hypothetical protein